MARQSLKAISDYALLHSYCTSLGWKTSWLHTLRSCLPKALYDKCMQRSYPLEQQGLQLTAWGLELARLMAQSCGLRQLYAHETGICCTDRVFVAHDRCVAHYLRTQAASGGIQGVYGYEDSCLETFREAKRQGLLRWYELPIVYWETAQNILKQEALRYPEWERTLLGNRDSMAKNERKTEELTLASHVIAPSPHVLDSLPAAIRQHTPCTLAPYGAPLRCLAHSPHTPDSSQPLRVLFAGSMTQRKGLADVFEAFRGHLKSSHTQLVIAGMPLEPLSFYRSVYPHFEYHPPCSNATMLRIMQSCHCLVLPSLIEGRAIVQLEALACGLPLIVTPNAGAADLIQSPDTGFLVPIRSPEAVAAAIDHYATHRAMWPTYRAACQAFAQHVSWADFRRRILSALLPSLP
jgi:glycosyltransferase involved in cell wall biosynthesis